MPGEQRHSAQDSLTLDSDLAEMPRLRDFVQVFCDRNALSEQVRDHLSIALEELAVNSVEHGSCDPRTRAIRIDLEMRTDRVQVTFSDTGVPFNPLMTPSPDLGMDLGRRPIGGLGIYLVRCLMPEIRYERRNGRNYLFMTKSIESKAEFAEQAGGSNASCHGDRPR